MTQFGIDISRWQGTIDWPALAPHIDFCIIKAGGSDDGIYEDSKFRYNQSGVRSFNIPHGYYYFAGGGDPVAEAEHFARLVSPIRPGELVALDYEIDHPDPNSYCMAFLTRLEELLGVLPLLYTNEARCSLFAPTFTRFPLWVASYYFDGTPNHTPNVAPWLSPAIFQYSSMATVPGISENTVDVNICNDFAALAGGSQQEDDDMADHRRLWQDEVQQDQHFDSPHTDIWLIRLDEMSKRHLNQPQLDLLLGDGLKITPATIGPWLSNDVLKDVTDQ